MILSLLFSLSVQTPSLPFLSPVFGDHMVLQRNRPNTFWGWTKPSEEVRLTIGGKTVRTRAGSDGKWQIRIDPPAAGGPYDLTVSGSQRVEFHDILVGDVWLCTGQSNMEMGVANVQNGAEEIAKANYPKIRLYEVPRAISLTPKAYAEGTWQVCSPEGITHGVWGGFSAAGYFFGRELNQRLNVPIGLVQSCWGGTVAEAWTSRDALLKMDDFRQAVGFAEGSKQPGAPTFERRMDDWFCANDPGSKPEMGLERPEVSDSDWKVATSPVRYDTLKIGDFVGTVWYRTTVEVDAAHAGKPAHLSLGPVSDCDRTWLNGKTLGATFEWSASRNYEIPAGLLKEGANVIAVRSLDTGWYGGMTAEASAQFLDFGSGDHIPLPTTWRFKPTMDLRGRVGLPIALFNEANTDTALYNGMIAPLVPMAIKGVIWYQGESNVNRGYQYRDLLPAMIKDWRTHFGQGDFPFLIVQLANFMGKVNEPRDNEWAELREAQAMTAAKVRNAGLATAIDIGMWNDIHPVNKQEVGRRLALVALNMTYGDKSIVASGPRFTSLKVEGANLRVQFKETNGGLSFRGSTDHAFAIAGADRKFFWAKAEIKGNEVVLISPDVPHPVAVRYAWAGNPDAPLYNGAGLPALPFRTDDWPGVTAPKHG